MSGSLVATARRLEGRAIIGSAPVPLDAHPPAGENHTDGPGAATPAFLGARISQKQGFAFAGSDSGGPGLVKAAVARDPSELEQRPCGERVLFVDDDAQARRAFARAMRRMGFIVDVAADAEEALELATRYPYAVIATDQVMPGLNGMGLVQRLQESCPESTYLLITGDRSLSLLDLQAPESLRSLLYKPWRDNELAALLAEGVQAFRERKYERTEERPSEEAVLLVCCSASEATDDLSAVRERAEHLRSFESLFGEPSSELRRCVEAEFGVQSACSLAEGLSLAKTQRFAVIVADVSAQGIDCQRVINALCASAPESAVVLLCEASRESEVRLALHRGAQDYLLKGPLNGPELVRSLRYAIERKQVQRHLIELAYYDQLTGLPNRTLFHERLAQALSRDGRHGRCTALLLVDVDDFKAVNETRGHSVGDALLRAVAGRLRGSVRDCDTVARLGGDEFAIVIEDLARDEEVTRVARRVLNSFATPMPVAGEPLTVTPSIGIAIHPENAKTPEELFKHADSAMYRAKENGRNNYQFFSEAFHQRALRRVKLEVELNRALEQEEFVLYYQPQRSLTTDRIIGLEALLRWVHPDGRLIPPAEFISTLEETGLINAVGEWLLHQGCEQLRRWSDEGLNSFRLALNVSARQFEDPAFASKVREALRFSRVSGSRLELEITESVLVRDAEAVRSTLDELKALGIRVAIDDFGTGYSSLQYLKLFPIGGLKIDRSFVKDIESRSSDAAIASAIIALAQALDLDVTAEGVETRAQADFLASRGCQFIQGYYSGRPSPVSQVSDWLRRDSKIVPR